MLQRHGPRAAPGLPPRGARTAQHQRRAMSLDVAIIDSGGANLASLQFALERLGARTAVTSDLAVIAAAPRVLLPGVGSALAAMERLNASGVAAHLPRLRQPVLGICLGMQLLYEK